MKFTHTKRHSSTQPKEQRQVQQIHVEQNQYISQDVLQQCTTEQTLIALASPKSPFGIEEVVYEIVSYLDKSSLHSCIFVSRVFYRASIRALWTSVYWKNFAWTDSFLSEFDRFGHCTIELHENYTSDLERIARVCTNLRELRLNWTSIADEKLADVLQNSPKISSLFLHSCRTLTSVALLNIAKLSGLKHLELKNMIHIDEPSFVTLLISCPMLEHLALEDVRLDKITLGSLGLVPLKIRTMALTRSSPTGSFVKNILRNAPMIKEFSMARNVHSILSKDDLLPFRDMYKHISSLNLESCKGIDSEAILTLIHACPELERVNVSGTNISDAGLDALASHCPKVTSLNLAWCAHITDGGLLRLLGTCKGLNFLDISTLDIISAAIFDLETPWACLQLETLIIIGINMTRPLGSVQRNHTMMFNQLSRLERLQDLAIGGANLVLELEAGLSKMEKLGNLESFRIKHLQTVLGEDEIRWLVEAWPKLKRVRFESGSLPAPWFRYFRRQRPHLVLG
ncbi:F-box and leucine-rich repeat protein 4 [Mortierella sp. AM989]|nr:F-box and leucine-rich repeat protein 4 [Mortierella sp. AM989]